MKTKAGERFVYASSRQIEGYTDEMIALANELFVNEDMGASDVDELVEKFIKLRDKRDRAQDKINAVVQMEFMVDD